MLVEVVACAAVAGKDPTGHTFVTGGGFFGLQPMSISGSLHGRIPIPADAILQQ